MTGQWIVKITHPSDAAGHFGPCTQAEAKAATDKWPFPQSAFRAPLRPMSALEALTDAVTRREEARRTEQMERPA